MHKTLVIFLVGLTLVLNAAAQEKTGYQSADGLQREVTFLLLDKNINDVTRQLDSEDAATVTSLLRRLIIYERAGQTSRVSKTLERLASVANWQCPADYDLKLLIRNAAAGDFRNRRLYYELCPDDSFGAEEFVRLWSSNGDPKEIDSWLAKRSPGNDEWVMQRVQLRAKAGTAGAVLDDLAAELRANPSDQARLVRYLRANSYAGNLQDVGWLAEAFDVRSAADYFLLAERIRTYSPQAGVKLLQQSLELPFTDADAKLVNDQINRSLSIGPTIKVNPEKQLRYWTKRSLAEMYQWMNQSLAAQPLVEELVSVKGDDVLLQEVHQLAGAVQSASGQRVVETKILADETARRSTSEYWLERTRYYEGRAEYGLERESYRQALVALPAAKSADTLSLNERYHLVRSFAFFLAEEHNSKEDQAELDKLLTSELNSAPPETDYAFQIAGLICHGDLQLNTVRNSLLAKRPSLLTQLLRNRRDWDGEETSVIQGLVNGDEVSSDLKNKIWSSLQQLVPDPGSTRAHGLAVAMTDSAEWQRAIPIWVGYIEHASADSKKNLAVSYLFTAYCRTNQWPAAEKLLLAQRDSLWSTLPTALAEVALVAAQQNAIEDAMRLWRMSANLDRRNLVTLPLLAQTNARPQLLAMYLEMKKEDPLSVIPDLALQLLR